MIGRSPEFRKDTDGLVTVREDRKKKGDKVPLFLMTISKWLLDDYLGFAGALACFAGAFPTMVAIIFPSFSVYFTRTLSPALTSSIAL